VVLVVALGWSAVTAAVLILLPLLWLRRDRTGRGFRLATGVYYVGLGAGYMLLEMALIQEFTRVLAEPVFAVAVVLSAFLVFSGLGSALAGRPSGARLAATWPPLAAVIGLAVLYVLVGRWALSAAVAYSMPVRVCVCLALAGALAVPMGMPFPRGLMRLSARSPGLIPWAWGANGFASVVAAAGAVVLAMSYGFAAVVWAAIGAYTIAAVAAIGLPSPRPSVDATDRQG
jgi:hypothetical protein